MKVGYTACHITWPAEPKCSAWGMPWTVHGCCLRPGHGNKHVCLCQHPKPTGWDK